MITLNYYNYEYSVVIKRELEKRTSNPIQRELLSKLPCTGKVRKKNTHLKRSKKR